MKTTIIFVVLLFGITIGAQTKIIEYDYLKGDFIRKKKCKDKNVQDTCKDQKINVEDNTTITFIVKNYNPLRYNLEIVSTPSGLSYQQKPDKFKYFDVSDAENATKAVPKINDTILAFKTFYNNLTSLNKKVNDLKQEKVLTKPQIAKRLSVTVSNLKGQIEPNPCDTLNCSDTFTNLSKMYIDQVKDRKIRLEIKLEDLNKSQKEAIDSTTAKNISETKVKLEKYTDLVKEIDKSYENDIATMISNYGKLDLLEYETRHDIAIDNTDRIKLKITGKDEYTGKSIDRPVSDIIVRKWLKIDFSTGAFWSRLYDQDYVKNIIPTTGQNNTTTNTYTINTLDKGKNSFGAMAFINFHTQRYDTLNFGLSLGTGLLFNQSTKIVLAPTASLLIGSNQRVIIHVGVAMAQVDRIISGYQDNVAFSDANYTPATKQYVKAEIMAGLSWNLAR